MGRGCLGYWSSAARSKSPCRAAPSRRGGRYPAGKRSQTARGGPRSRDMLWSSSPGFGEGRGDRFPWAANERCSQELRTGQLLRARRILRSTADRLQMPGSDPLSSPLVNPGFATRLPRFTTMLPSYALPGPCTGHGVEAASCGLLRRERATRRGDPRNFPAEPVRDRANQIL